MVDSPLSPPAKPPQSDSQLWSGIGLVGEIGYLIALPAILLGFGGALLDKRLETSPLFLLLGFCLAFAASMLVVIQRVKSFLAKTSRPSPTPTAPDTERKRDPLPS